MYTEYHYIIRFTLGNPSGSHQWRGELKANIHGTNGQLGQRLVTDEYVQITSMIKAVYIKHPPENPSDALY